MSKRGELQGDRQVKGKIKDNGDAESKLRETAEPAWHGPGWGAFSITATLQ